MHLRSHKIASKWLPWKAMTDKYSVLEAQDLVKSGAIRCKKNPKDPRPSCVFNMFVNVYCCLLFVWVETQIYECFSRGTICLLTVRRKRPRWFSKAKP